MTDIDAFWTQAISQDAAAQLYGTVLVPATGAALARIHLALEASADRAYRACFARHLGEQANFVALKTQALALIDGLR